MQAECDAVECQSICTILEQKNGMTYQINRYYLRAKKVGILPEASNP